MSEAGEVLEDVGSSSPPKGVEADGIVKVAEPPVPPRLLVPEGDDAASVVEAAGHFRIYLGAAAGVGKTYDMLNEGKRRLEPGNRCRSGVR